MTRMIFSLAMAVALFPAMASADSAAVKLAESVEGARQALRGLEEGGLGRADVLRIRTRINREIQRLDSKIKPLQDAYDMQSQLCYFNRKPGCDDFVDQLGYRLQNLKGFREFLADLLLDLQ